MTVTQLKIDGTTYLCVVTPYENSRIAKGVKVTIPTDRRVKMRMGIPRSVQLAAAGISAPPIVF